MNIPTLKHLHKAQSKVAEETHRNHAQWFFKHEAIIDLLLVFSYIEQPDYQGSKAEQFFHAFVFDFYVGLPTTLESISILIENGHYNDALNLIRSLKEAIIKCLFFNSNKELLEEYESEQRKIEIKKMWSYIAGEASYKVIYKLLSKYEHKNFGSNLPRLNFETNNRTGYSALPEFNPRMAVATINFLVHSNFTILNTLQILFPYQWSKVDQNFIDEHKRVIDLLRNHIKETEKQFPESGELVRITEKINGIKSF